MRKFLIKTTIKLNCKINDFFFDKFKMLAYNHFKLNKNPVVLFECGVGK